MASTVPITEQIADCQLVHSRMPPLTVAVNMLKITNVLKAFVGFGFGLYAYLFAFSYSFARDVSKCPQKQTITTVLRGGLAV